MSPSPSPNELLLRSAERGDIGGLRAAIAEGADKLDAALRNAAERGRVPAAAYLLDCGADPNTFHGYALAVAAGAGRDDMVELLLARGANPNARSCLALSWAAERDQEGSVRLLLDHGADLHANEDFALRQAAKGGAARSVRLLLERGADVMARGAEALILARGNVFSSEAAGLLESAFEAAKDAARKKPPGRERLEAARKAKP